jgi:uncharacterized protein YfcZ (UPF0381/DUF406 family)
MAYEDKSGASNARQTYVGGKRDPARKGSQQGQKGHQERRQQSSGGEARQYLEVINQDMGQLKKMVRTILREVQAIRETEEEWNGQGTARTVPVEGPQEGRGTEANGGEGAGPSYDPCEDHELVSYTVSEVDAAQVREIHERIERSSKSVLAALRATQEALEGKIDSVGDGLRGVGSPDGKAIERAVRDGVEGVAGELPSQAILDKIEDGTNSTEGSINASTKELAKQLSSECASLRKDISDLRKTVEADLGDDEGIPTSDFAEMADAPEASPRSGRHMATSGDGPERGRAEAERLMARRRAMFGKDPVPPEVAERFGGNPYTGAVAPMGRTAWDDESHKRFQQDLADLDSKLGELTRQADKVREESIDVIGAFAGMQDLMVALDRDLKPSRGTKGGSDGRQGSPTTWELVAIALSAVAALASVANLVLTMAA